MQTATYNDSVFISCPFGNEYTTIFRVIVQFTDAGFSTISIKLKIPHWVMD